MENEQENEKIEGIQLTEEFQNDKHCQPCTIVELISLFKNDEKNNPNFDNPIIKDTREYLYTFNKYGISENITTKAYNSRKLFDVKDITPEEQTLLVDLAPSKYQEAFSLIPTLKDKISPEKMQELLDKLNIEVVIE